VSLLFVLSYILCPYYLYCHIYSVLSNYIIIYIVSLLIVVFGVFFFAKSSLKMEIINRSHQVYTMFILSVEL